MSQQREGYASQFHPAMQFFLVSCIALSIFLAAWAIIKTGRTTDISAQTTDNRQRIDRLENGYLHIQSTLDSIIFWVKRNEGSIKELDRTKEDK